MTQKKLNLLFFPAAYNKPHDELQLVRTFKSGVLFKCDF